MKINEIKAAITEDNILGALVDVQEEIEDAIEQFGGFNSYHEGYAVILEELDELWEEIKKWPKTHRPSLMRNEAKQVAAMAVKFMVMEELEETNKDY